MTKAHKVYQPLTSISELYLLPKKTKNDTETTTGDCCRELLLDDLSDLPAKLSSPCCDHCRSSIVFKYTICLYQDYTHLSVKGYPAISCPFQTCSEARAISRPFQQFSSESPRTSGIARGDVLLVPWCHQLQLRFLVLVFIVVMHAPLFGT